MHAQPRTRHYREISEMTDDQDVETTPADAPDPVTHDIRWPDPSPLQSWWSDVMEGGSPT